LKADNDKADEVIGQLQRQSDFDKQNMEKLKDEIDKERRNTAIAHDNLNKKIKALED